MRLGPNLRRVSAALVALSLIGLLPAGAFAAVPSLGTATVQSNLSIPWDLDFLPSGQMLVTERAGRVRIYDSGSPGAALNGTFTVPSVRAEGEAGLMGIAVDVDFAANHFVYLCA